MFSIKLEKTILPLNLQEVLKYINQTSEKFQRPDLDIEKRHLFCSSLNLFIKKPREKSSKKLIEYKTKAIS